MTAVSRRTPAARRPRGRFTFLRPGSINSAMSDYEIGDRQNSSKPQPADNVLPFQRPTASCNARLHRGEGYCNVPAGGGTDHPGIGRCRLHGGEAGDEAIDGPTDLFRAAGLDPIINLAETMQHSDQEYLMEVGNNALVVTRSGILAKLQDPYLSSREINDLTNALTRVDNIISKRPNSSREEDERNAAAEEAEDAEITRLRKIQGGR